MAHYAILNQNLVVVDVITGVHETELIEGLDPETWYSNFIGQRCVRTSYNTSAGVHTMGGVPFRKNYAGIGYTYDPVDDAFIAPMPECGHPELTLNELKIWECSACEAKII